MDHFDVAIRKGLRERATRPHVLGHEIAGEVAGVGPGVEGWSPGDRVASTLYLVCGIAAGADQVAKPSAKTSAAMSA